MEWRDKANCKGNTEDFFPDENDPLAEQREKFAKAKCAACPVRELCLEAGLGEKFGIWGGTNPKERVILRRSRSQQTEKTKENPGSDRQNPRGD